MFFEILVGIKTSKCVDIRRPGKSTPKKISERYFPIKNFDRPFTAGILTRPPPFRPGGTNPSQKGAQADRVDHVFIIIKEFKSSKPMLILICR